MFLWFVGLDEAKSFLNDDAFFNINNNNSKYKLLLMKIGMKRCMYVGAHYHLLLV